MEVINVEKGRKIKVLSLVALVVAVLGLTVAFAALSQTLTINGSASVDAASWDVGFISNEDGTIPITVKTEGAAQVLSEYVATKTSISNISVSITKPGDIVTYGTLLKNSGTINARIESIEVSELCTLSSPVESCDWDNDGSVTQEDVDKVNKNISFKASAVPSIESDVNLLKANAYGKFLLLVGYGKYEINSVGGSYNKIEESTELPKRDLTFNDLSVTVNFVQAD